MNWLKNLIGYFKATDDTVKTEFARVREYVKDVADDFQEFRDQNRRALGLDKRPKELAK